MANQKRFKFNNSLHLNIVLISKYIVKFLNILDMKLKEKIEKLAQEKSLPSVTIALNTHKTRPDYEKDKILLKNLLKEAENRLLAEFDKRKVAGLIEKLSKIAEEVDYSRSLKSLHIFLSDNTKEIIKSPLPLTADAVHISDSFSLRHVIQAYLSEENYMILLLTQESARLFEAWNDEVISEIKNENFPFDYYNTTITDSNRRSDPKLVDDIARTFFNRVDKAIVNIHNQNDLKCVIISTQDNYDRFMQVADNVAIYKGFANKDYNNAAMHDIAAQAWEVINKKQQAHKQDAVNEMKEAVSKAQVLTDLQEIYQAAIDGKGDLLVVHQDFVQPVMMKDERTFERIDDASLPSAIDDITNKIIWEVMSKNGRVVFISHDESNDLGEIALKTRY